jgi:precorrin-6B methylase 2
MTECVIWFLIGFFSAALCVVLLVRKALAILIDKCARHIKISEQNADYHRRQYLNLLKQSASKNLHDLN